MKLKWILITYLFSLFVIMIQSIDEHSARASHILVDTETEIDAIREKIRREGDTNDAFSKYAKQNSKCPSARSGGSLGEFPRGTMVPEFDKIVFEGNIGEIYKVKTQFGWHLVITTFRSNPSIHSGL